jgi:hypothetical protein
MTGTVLQTAADEHTLGGRRALPIEVAGRPGSTQMFAGVVVSRILFAALWLICVQCGIAYYTVRGTEPSMSPNVTLANANKPTPRFPLWLISSETWLTLVMSCSLVALSLFPIFNVKLPPLTDYPAHLARLYIITHQHDELLTTFYTVHWPLVSGIGMDSVFLLISNVTDVFFAGKLLIVLTLLTMISGTFALHYVLYREWKGQVISFLFIFNGIFLYGFLPYVLAVGVALWATAGWVALRNMFWLLRLIFATCAVCVLFLTHLGGVALFGLAVFCYEISRLHRREWHLRSIDFAVAAASFLIVIPLLLREPMSHEWPKIQWLTLESKWIGLYFTIRSANLLVDGFVALCLLILLTYLMYSKRLVMPRLAWLFLIFASATYLVIPSTIGNAEILDIRLPVAFLLFLIAMMRWRIDTPITTAVFNSVIVILATIRVIGVAQAWQAYSEVVSEYEASLAQVERGSRILVVTNTAGGWRGSGNKVTIGMDRLAIIHLPALATIERSCLTTSVFADPGNENYRSVSLREPYRDAVPKGGLEVTDLEAPSDGSAKYLQEWRDHYDYLYVQFAPPDSHPGLPGLTLVYQGSSFQLYRVTAWRRSALGAERLLTQLARSMREQSTSLQRKL